MSASSFIAETVEVQLKMANMGLDFFTGLGNHCKQAVVNMKQLILENRPSKPHDLCETCPESDILTSSSGTDESEDKKDNLIGSSDSEMDDSDDSFVYVEKTIFSENMQGKADSFIVEDIHASNDPKDTLTSDPSVAADGSAPARPQFELCVPEGSELHNDPTFFAAAQLDKSKSFETNEVFTNQMIRYFNFQVELRENLSGLKLFKSPPVIQAVYMLASYIPPLKQPVLIKFMKDRFDLYNNSGCAKMALFYMILLEMYRDEKYSQCVAQDITYLILKQGELEYNEEEFAKVEGTYYFYAKESTEWQSEKFIPYVVKEQLEQMRENGENVEETK